MRRNPKTPTQRALTFGEPFDDTDLDNQWVERGTIIAVNPPTCTCDVEVETQGSFNGIAFPYLVQDSEGSGGHIYVPRPGQQVIVQQGIGTPFITQVLPRSTDVNTDVGAASALATSTTSGTAAFNSAAPANYAARLPKDLLPGDWMWRGNQGQYLALFDGGAADFHATPWSRVICSQQDDTTTIIGRNLKLITGFGNLRFTDDGGKSGLVLEGGTDQTLETGFGRENWTVQARIGGEAEGFADFRINNRDGDTIAKTVWGADGSIQQSSSGDQTQRYLGNMTFNFDQNHTRQVEGTETVSVGGDQVENYYGSQLTSVSQNRTVQVLNDCTHQINRDWSMKVGRIHRLAVSGDVLATPGAAAADWKISQGWWVVDVGFPGTDISAAQSGIQFNTYMPNGNIGLSTLAGKIILDTALPTDTVFLGSTGGVAPFYGVLWEPLKALLEQFITWAQNHIHPTGMGPSGTAVVPFPAESVLKPMVPLIQSRRVKIGA